jgi:hypothetical protein
MDLLIFGKSEVHPAYLAGTIPSSRISLILWTNIPRPQNNYWQLWLHDILHKTNTGIHVNAMGESQRIPIPPILFQASIHSSSV